MGIVSDKPVAPTPRGLPHSRPSQHPTLPLLETDPIAKTKFLEAIKKRDIILFKKTLESYNVKPTDLVGPANHHKTVLHKLAEHNFSEAMALVLRILSTQKPEITYGILNLKDNDGNTPLLLCCLYNSVETLEVLSKNEYVDMEAKNAAKKTALEIAMEMESPCVNVLSSQYPGSIGSTKSTLKSTGNDSSNQLQSLEETSKEQSDRDNDSGSGVYGSMNSIGRRTSLQTKENKELKELRDSLKGDIITRFPQMLADLEAKGANFIDTEFPHETCYLALEEVDQVALKKKYPGLQWRRPMEFMGPSMKATAVFDGFTPADISKSPLVGSEIYSAFAAMAEFPQRLSKVFNTKEVNKSGIYSLNFAVAGIPIEILLDDYFPCYDGNKLLFSRPVAQELWFLLLEKAFAKLYGGYGELENIGVLEAFEVLTGMPVAQTLIKNADEDRLWRKLLDYDKKNYVICAGEVMRKGNEDRNRIFNVVSMYEVSGHRLLKLRNHFGHYNWKGDFSMTSSQWTKDLKETVGFSPNDKSCFYMSVKDFVREFDFFTVCHYHDNWVRSQINVFAEPNHYVYFEANTEKETEAYISVHQKQPQFVDEGPEYDISPVEIVMSKELDENYYQNIAFGEQSAFLGKPTVYVQEGLEIKLKPGKYILCIKVKWSDQSTHEFCLNALSSSAIKLTQLNRLTMSNFLEKVYLSAGMVSQEKFDMTNGCEFASGWAGSHLWVCAFNKGPKTWTLEINFERMQNLKLAKKFRNVKPNIVKLVVPPNQKAVAYAKRTSPSPVVVAWKFNQSWA